MRSKISCAAAALITLSANTASGQGSLDTAYFSLHSDYGRLMVYAEACDLSTRFGLKYDALQALSGKLDIMKVELDLDRAFEGESYRSGKVECDPKITRMYADSFSRSIDNIVELIANGGEYNAEPKKAPAPAVVQAPEPPSYVPPLTVSRDNTAMVGGKIFYGSRAGMSVTISAISGIDTNSAVIEASITTEDATAYCKEYVGQVTDDCIEQQLQTKLASTVAANCESGVFQDFSGSGYQFMGGMNPAYGQSTEKYAIIDLKTREVADGSMASGYFTNLALLDALCPGKGLHD